MLIFRAEGHLLGSVCKVQSFFGEGGDTCGGKLITGYQISLPSKS